MKETIELTRELIDLHYRENCCCGNCVHLSSRKDDLYGLPICKIADSYVSVYGTCNKYKYNEEQL
jgi:hypothetical protein